MTDRGILTESPAMLAFIAQNFPETGLERRSTSGFAQIQTSIYLCATLHVWRTGG